MLSKIFGSSIFLKKDTGGGYSAMLKKWGFMPFLHANTKLELERKIKNVFVLTHEGKRGFLPHVIVLRE